ncbi:DUF881 domain-containing protein [Gephyromycinifex aptenodytis]|uniref:DUF881 domain-containing protein n=1 Tax=Gephyromycinifex aptenodytis TaxID=2716227 RepID=UPI0014469E39|nr:DUF881 domain-containing protein [Gephyromycinifex aptenodytis]
MSTPVSDPQPAPARPEDGRGRGLLRLRLTRSTLLGGALTAALGLALSTQIHQTQQQGLESLREPELIGILDNITERRERLDRELRELELERAELARDSGGTEALRRADARVDALAVLAGTAPAEGPGIVAEIKASPGAVGSETLLDGVQELRDAGAEAIQIGDVRVVASTAFTQDDAGRILVAGKALNPPYRLLAVGEAQTLASALDIPGGVNESLRQAGAKVEVKIEDSVLVNALHAPSPARYAHPVPAAGGDSAS